MPKSCQCSGDAGASVTKTLKAELNKIIIIYSTHGSEDECIQRFGEKARRK
jgi:hypothetical protein